MPKITVSIPTYNRSHSLKRAIDSVLNQSFQDFEIKIFDNCSTDNTLQMVKSYNDDRIIIIGSEKNFGLEWNFKRSLTEKSSSDFVAWLHDDDAWYPTHLEEAMRCFEKQKSAAIYSCDVEYTEDTSHFNRNKFSNSPEAVSLIKREDNISQLIWLKGIQICCSTLIFKKDLISNIIWDHNQIKWTLDYLIFFQLIQKSDWILNANTNVLYLRHEQSTTNAEGWSTSIIGATQFRYAIRFAAVRLLEYISPQILLKNDSVVNNEALIVSITSIDTPYPIRNIGFFLFKNFSVPPSSKHLKIAFKIGAWYLYIADIIDRIRGDWYPPKIKV